MTGKVIKLEMQETFRSCPTCGYRDGFHSSFQKEGALLKWLLVCPSCHDTFDIGLTADRQQEMTPAG
jgi:Zn finger protein HypA/HybF involved in hydrogenase expression